MCFEVKLGIEHHKLLLKTLPIQTNEMVILEMSLQRRVVHIIMRLSRISPVTNETSLVLVAAMLIKLVTVVEPLAAKVAQRVSLETGLINGARFVIPLAHMIAQLLIREHLMFVCKDLLVPRAEIAHLLVMRSSDVAMQIRPAKAREIAVAIGTVIS